MNEHNNYYKDDKLHAKSQLEFPKTIATAIFKKHVMKKKKKTKLN